MSSRPKRSTLRATSGGSASSSPRWAGTPSASPPIARRCASVSAQASGLRLATTTDAPAATKPSAIARPMPRVPPVTIATRPERSKSRCSRSRSMRSPRLDVATRDRVVGRGRRQLLAVLREPVRGEVRLARQDLGELVDALVLAVLDPPAPVDLAVAVLVDRGAHQELLGAEVVDEVVEVDDALGAVLAQDVDLAAVPVVLGHDLGVEALRRHLEELGAALRLVDVVATDAAAGVVLGEQLLHLGEVRRVEAAEVGDAQALARLDVGQALDLSGEGGEVGAGHA